MDEKLTDLLVRSFDQQLSNKELFELEEGLKNSKELREQQLQFVQLRTMLQNKADSFKDDFDSKVMSRIKQEKFNSNVVFLYKRIAYTGAASIAVLIGIHLYSGGSITVDSLLGIESVSKDILTFNVIGH